MISSFLATGFLTTGDGIEFVFLTFRVGVLDAEGCFFRGDAGYLLGVLLVTFFTFLLLVDAELFYF